MSRAALRWLQRLALILGGTLAGLLGGELIVRGLQIAPPARPIQVNRPVRATEDPRQRVENSPGARWTVTYPHADGSAPLVVEHNINAHGRRGPLAPLLRRTSRPRIAVLGDSFTFGSGVGDDETWPAQMRAAWQRASDDDRPGVEVLNFGVPGHDILQHAWTLEHRALDYHPDLVVLCWYVNDLAIPGKIADEIMAPLPDWVTQLSMAERPGSLLEGSELMRLVVKVFVKPRLRSHNLNSHERLYANDHPAWRTGRNALLHMRDQLANVGIDFLVVLYPSLFLGTEGLATHQAYTQVLTFCDDEGIDVLDLEPTFIDADVEALRVHPHNAHPNPEAHRMAAETIHAHIEEQGWLLPEPPAASR